MLGIRSTREIQKQTTNCIYLWEIGLHLGLVRDGEAEGADSEGRSAREGEEEDKEIIWSYSTVMSGKLRQAVHLATRMEGGGCLLPDD